MSSQRSIIPKKNEININGNKITVDDSHKYLRLTTYINLEGLHLNQKNGITSTDLVDNRIRRGNTVISIEMLQCNNESIINDELKYDMETPEGFIINLNNLDNKDYEWTEPKLYFGRDILIESLTNQLKLANKGVIPDDYPNNERDKLDYIQQKFSSNNYMRTMAEDIYGDLKIEGGNKSTLLVNKQQTKKNIKKLRKTKKIWKNK